MIVRDLAQMLTRRFFRRHQGYKTGWQAYNASMTHALPSPSRAAVVALLLTLGAGVSAQTASPAQTPGPDAASTAPAARALPQKATERIRTEDAGSRIDEVRVGGETQSITVQPKTGSNMPAYEVKPSDSTKGSAPSSSKGDTNGSRVWNVLKF